MKTWHLFIHSHFVRILHRQRASKINCRILDFSNAVAICKAVGKGLKKTKCPAVRTFSRISWKNPFSNRSKVFYLRWELPNDQENKNDFAAERLRFLGHRAESTPFRHLENWFREKQCLTHRHVFIQTKYPADYIICLTVHWTLCTRLATLRVDEIISMVADCFGKLIEASISVFWSLREGFLTFQLRFQTAGY